MFSFFHKKKHSPGESPEDTSQAPIPGPEDGFVVINQGKGDVPSAGGSIYPSINPGGPSPGYPNPYGSFPQPAAPNLPKKEVGFLQGVPFSLSKELLSDTDRDVLALQQSEMLAFIAGQMKLHKTEYDFAVEKSVLMES